MSLLAVVLFIPLIGFFAILFAPRNSKLAFAVALGATVATFISSLGLIGPVLANPAQFTSVVERLMDR